MAATFNAALTFVCFDTPVTLPLELDLAFDNVAFPSLVDAMSALVVLSSLILAAFSF
jgi:hypothetical protein